MVTVAIYTTNGHNAGICSWIDHARIALCAVTRRGNHNNVMGERSGYRVEHCLTGRVSLGHRNHFRPVVHCPLDARGETYVAKRASTDRQDRSLWRDSEHTVTVIWTMSMGGNQARHRGAMAIDIGPAVSVASDVCIGTRNDVAHKIGV
jgi:hypothetical protein